MDARREFVELIIPDTVEIKKPDGKKIVETDAPPLPSRDRMNNKPPWNTY